MAAMTLEDVNGRDEGGVAQRTIALAGATGDLGGRVLSALVRRLLVSAVTIRSIWSVMKRRLQAPTARGLRCD